MTIRYQVKMEGASGPLALSDWSGLAEPRDDFVVARHSDGSVASRYGDLVWCMDAYHPHRQPVSLNFEFWGQVNPSRAQLDRARELRWFVFLLMWCRPVPLRVVTLSGYLYDLIAVARFSVARSVSLKQLFESDVLLESARRALPPYTLSTLGMLLGFLDLLGPETAKCNASMDRAVRNMRADFTAYQSNLKQHSPIPTRIYSHLLIALHSWLAAFSTVADEAIEYAVSFAQLERFALGNVPPPPIPTALSAYLGEVGFLQGPRSVISALKAAQIAAKLQVQAFSGMRDEEACSLRYDCIEEHRVDGLTHFILRGITTKFHEGASRATKWVTSREGVAAVTVARRISMAVGRFLGVTDVGALPLFVSTAYLAGEARRAIRWNGQSVRLANLDFTGNSRQVMWPVLCPAILDADIQELEHIDPHRAWRAEPRFSIGSRWPLTSHQLRRSLALYAQRSGLVSLPSLKRQLQHITEEMSRYYARGSAFATDFLTGEAHHIGREWQAAQPISSALSYMLHVLNAGDVLFGGHVQWLDRNLRDSKGVLVFDREATMRRFRKGELAYRETVLGGCASLDSCKSAAVRTFDVECVAGCTNLVGRLSRLERVIVAQERLVAALEPDTVEHATEMRDLRILREARERVVASSAEIA